MVRQAARCRTGAGLLGLGQGLEDGYGGGDRDGDRDRRAVVRPAAQVGGAARFGSGQDVPVGAVGAYAQHVGELTAAGGRGVGDPAAVGRPGDLLDGVRSVVEQTHRVAVDGTHPELGYTTPVADEGDLRSGRVGRGVPAAVRDEPRRRVARPRGVGQGDAGGRGDGLATHVRGRLRRLDGPRRVHGGKPPDSGPVRVERAFPEGFPGQIPCVCSHISSKATCHSAFAPRLVRCRSGAARSLAT